MSIDETRTRFWFRFVAQIFLLFMTIVSVWICPYSKVEESFPLQATHDLWYYGISLVTSSSSSSSSSYLWKYYDHLRYPGVVPRTFVGPILLVVLLRCLSGWNGWFNNTDNSILIMTMIRYTLLGLVLHGWFRLARSLDSNMTLGKSITTARTTTKDYRWKGTYLLLITAVQFHMTFYSSRLLPNTFAMWLILHAYAEWFLGNINRAAIFLILTTAIFRCDVLLLLFTIGLSWLIQGQITILHALKIGLMTGIICLVFTVPLDSYFWQSYWIWPEGQVFYYNTILGKSSDWGTSPWHWYFTNALPKSLLFTAFLIPFAILRIPEQQRQVPNLRNQKLIFPIRDWIDTTMLPYYFPILGFIGLYSCLGHKEMRFLFPAMPMLNVAAASGMERLHHAAFFRNDKKDKVPWKGAKYVLFGALLVCILPTLLANLIFHAVSHYNYPGGTALQLLINHQQQLIQPQQKGPLVVVYIDVAAAMTGVSLFGQRMAGPDWQFEKAGYEAEHSGPKDYTRFTHILSERKDIPGFHILATAPGNPRLNWRYGRIETTDAIYVLQRNDE